MKSTIEKAFLKKVNDFQEEVDQKLNEKVLTAIAEKKQSFYEDSGNLKYHRKVWKMLSKLGGADLEKNKMQRRKEEPTGPSEYEKHVLASKKIQDRINKMGKVGKFADAAVEKAMNGLIGVVFHGANKLSKYAGVKEEIESNFKDSYNSAKDLAADLDSFFEQVELDENDKQVIENYILNQYELSEVSKDTCAKYIRSATADRSERAAKQGHNISDSLKRTGKVPKDSDDKIDQRTKGLGNAFKRIAK